MSDDTLDRSAIEELREATGNEFLVELIETFLAEAPVMIADLEDAAETEDADSFRRAAHSIKSNANTFGATALAALAKEMELTGQVDSIDTLKAVYRETAEALKVVANG